MYYIIINVYLGTTRELLVKIKYVSLNPKCLCKCLCLHLIVSLCSISQEYTHFSFICNQLDVTFKAGKIPHGNFTSEWGQVNCSIGLKVLSPVLSLCWWCLKMWVIVLTSVKTLKIIRTTFMYLIKKIYNFINKWKLVYLIYIIVINDNVLLV